MSFLEKNLLPDEKIKYRTKKHFIIFFTPVVWTIVTICFLLYSDPLIKKISVGPALIALGSWAHQFLNYYVSEFVVTNKRIMLREGFFIRHLNETRLATIANVSVNQSLVGQLLNYGTLLISAFGGETDPFVEIASPNDLQRALQIELDKKP